MIGLLITSFLQGKVSPTMTSTTCNLCAEHATAGSKTGLCKESHGAILSSNRGGTKTVGVGMGAKGLGMRMIMFANDLLPFEHRPIKAKRRKTRQGWGWRVEVYTFRRVWHSHHKYAVRKQLSKLNLLKRLETKRK